MDRGEAVYVTVGADAPTPKLKLSANYYFFYHMCTPLLKIINAPTDPANQG